MPVLVVILEPILVEVAEAPSDLCVDLRGNGIDERSRCFDSDSCPSDSTTRCSLVLLVFEDTLRELPSVSDAFQTGL